MAADPLLDAFTALLRRRSQSPLVASARRVVTVGRVDELARGVARLLAAGRLPAGRPVGLAAPNGAGFLAGLLALRRQGLPVLLLDHKMPAAEKLRAAQALGASALLRSSQPWPAGGDAFALDAVGSPRQGLAEVPPEIGFLKLTSGSTGAPRGILTPSEALLADDLALAATMGLRTGERILAAVPMSHSYGLSSVVLPALVRGSLLVLPEEGHPLAAIDAAREMEVTFLPTVPAYLQALLKLAEPPPYPPSLRLLITAGAPLRPATAVRFRETYGRRVRVFYGASESGGICFDRAGTAGEEGTLGTPVAGVRVELVPEPNREPGEGAVRVSSSAVAAGYYPEPCGRLSGGTFSAGDLATFRGEELVLLGRTDDLINVKGKKVNPREVEAALGRLPGASEAAVLGVPLAQGGEAVRAVIATGEIATENGGLCFESVQAFCRRHLAEHKVPRSVIVVRELPRTPRGKLDRAAMRALQTENPKG